MISKHFKIQELVPESIYKRFGENSWWFIDSHLVELLDFMREYWGKPITINNWHEGKERQESGFRLPKTETGGDLSQHKFGRAADIHVEGMTPEEVYNDIIANQNIFMEHGLTTMEDITMTKTWNHVDIRDTGKDYILIVKPL